MKTYVGFVFHTIDADRGAKAILSLAGCGDDVATVEELPALRRSLAEVKLEEKDPRVPILLQLLIAQGVSWLPRKWDVYTDDELSSAELLVLDFDMRTVLFGGPRMGTTYDISNACKKCGAGARQTSPMLVDGTELGALEGRHANSTPYNDILVDARLAENLMAAQPKGLSFRNVYAVMEDKRQISLPWRQINAAHTLPKMSPQSTGIEKITLRPCTLCTRSGLSSTQEEPLRLAYRKEDLAQAEDVNVTWEWFGDVKFNGNVSEALFPYPWFLVTPKVWRVFRDAGVTEFTWIPIRVVDE